MNKTLIGYPYVNSPKLEKYLNAFVYILDNLQNHRHTEFSIVEGRFGLTRNEFLQCVAKAETVLNNSSL